MTSASVYRKVQKCPGEQRSCCEGDAGFGQNSMVHLPQSEAITLRRYCGERASIASQRWAIGVPTIALHSSTGQQMAVALLFVTRCHESFVHFDSELDDLALVGFENCKADGAPCERFILVGHMSKL